MIGLLEKWGFQVIIGFLAGLCAIWWIEPRTPGGSALLILTMIFFVLGLWFLLIRLRIVVRLARRIRKRSNETPNKAEPVLSITDEADKKSDEVDKKNDDSATVVGGQKSDVTGA